ncbi:hypothetical protein ACFQ7F_07345 [Streptomyces sp. NPDC056486]|uniref:hypothetical protein n=1 Tax=Streptomyces sp. NPDC056486 TaxID=3345835 RepID=UPI00367678FB
MSHLRGPVARILPRGSAVAGIAAAAMALAGCGTQDEPPMPVDSLVGQSVAQVEGKVPEDASMVSYDLSKPVTGAKPRFGISDDGTHNDWIVVAACANTKNVEDKTRLAVGVLNTDAYSKAIAQKAKSHAFDRYLSECK